MIDVLEPDVLLAREGDHAAFHRLVSSCANTVTAIAFAIVRNVDASEDIAQEVFLVAWAKLRSLRNPASFLPWLRQITRNQAHLWQRQHACETVDAEVLRDAVDGAISPVEHLLRDEEGRVVKEVLDALPADTRELLILYYREQQSATQVSELLGISAVAVRQRLSRARAVLRAELLDRFGATVSRTAPGAAFVAAVATALVAAAPKVSAAVAVSATATKASGGVALLAKATLAGGLLGWLGVLMGMRLLDPPFDEREARELRRFRAVVLLLATIGCAAVAVSVPSAIATLVACRQCICS